MFNNAGNPGSIGGIEDIDMAMFDRTVAIHLRGVFLGIRAAARVMRPQGHGSIINTVERGRAGRQLRRPRLQRLQGGHRPSDPHDGQRARRARRPGQRHLSRRHRHLDLRPGRRASKATTPRPPWTFMTSALGDMAPIRRAGPTPRHRRGRPVAGQRRLELRQRPGHCRRRRSHHRPPLPRATRQARRAGPVPAIPGALSTRSAGRPLDRAAVRAGRRSRPAGRPHPPRG